MKTKKALLITGVTALVASLTVGLMACDIGGKNTGSKTEVNTKDVYAVSALSGVNYLSATEKGGAAEGQTPATARPVSVTDEDVYGIKDCLTMFDNVISGGGIQQTVEKNTDAEGEYADYKFVMTITVPGNETVKMYYNEVEAKTEREIEDGEEEVEVSTTLRGIMVFAGAEYEVSGEHKVETEGNEKEESVEFTTKSKDNPLNYVKIKQSVEEENGESEIEYEYEIYENGKKVREFELEIENENGKTEISLDVKTNGVQGKTKYKIVKGEKDGEFTIKYTVNAAKNNIKAERTETGYKFTYGNGYSEVI